MPLSLFSAGSFFSQPLDVILLNILITMGWIPIAVTLVWGFIMIWKDNRQGQYIGNLSWILLAINVPPATEQTPKSLENFFANLYGAHSTLLWKEIWVMGKTQPIFSFEIVSTEGNTQFMVRCHTRWRDVVEAGIYAQYPEAEIAEVEDYTSFAPKKFPEENWDMWGIELKLKNPDIFPIRTYLDFEDKLSQELKDPLGQILEQLAKMKPGENYWIQILIQPDGEAVKKWKKNGEKFINKIFGVSESAKPSLVDTALTGILAVPSGILDSATGVNVLGMLGYGPTEKKEEDIWKAFKLTMAEKEQAEGVVRKVAKVGFKTKLRIVYLARKGVYDKPARTALVKGMFHQFTHLNLNAFTLHSASVPKDDYFWQRWQYPHKQTRLLSAFRRRSWGIGATPWFLNVEELSTLWHFPAIGVKAPLIYKSDSRRGEPPVGLPLTLVEAPLGPPPGLLEEEVAPSTVEEEGKIFSGPVITEELLPRPPEEAPPNLPV